MTKLPAGRPSKYQVDYNEQARKLCLLGYTDVQLGDFFGVSETTINNWKREKEGFLVSLNAGKVIADADIVESLYNRAKGYSHDEEKVFCNMGEIVTHDTTKHYPPDPTSMIFWLKNRQPNKWREKQEIEQTTTVIQNIMPTPTADNIDTWEEAAQKQQDAMLNDS